MRPLAALIVLAALASALCRAGETTSAALWAEYVKAPNGHPNLPNCSYAGYHCGETPPPERKVVANVKECGAKGDGKTDDTAAFEAALKKANEAQGGAVLVPAGTYALSGMVRLCYDGVVLRGEGADKTTLSFQRPLDQVLGRYSWDGRNSAYGWSGGLVWIGPADDFTPDGKLKVTKDGNWEYWKAGEKLAAASAPAKRGDLTVQVDAAGAGRLKPGTTYLVTWENPKDKSLLIHMAGHESMKGYDWDKQGAGLVREERWYWPVEVVKVEGGNVSLKQPLRIDIRPEWGVAFWALGPCVREAGIEKLTLQMPPVKKNLKDYKNHLKDAGFNGIYLNKCLHCFVREVTIVEPENGLIHAAAKNTTVAGLILKGSTNHHATALRVMSHDNLISDFRFESNPMHGANTEGLSTGNVWRNGDMRHGTFDSHCAMSFESLRTNIVVNSDGRPGGGGESGPFLGARVVHWNVVMTAGKPEWINNPEAMPMGALVGIQGAPRVTGGKDLWHMIPGEKGCVIADEGKAPAPPDLYAAQLDLRMGRKSFGPGQW
jgi:hypothetical protein